MRQGSILQPRWPAALGNRAHTLARVQSDVLALLALATGGDVPAPNSVYNIYFLRGFDRARDEFFLCSDGVAVGYGARPFADGLDAIYYVAQKNYPAEFMEMVFPLRLRATRCTTTRAGPGASAGVRRGARDRADRRRGGRRRPPGQHPLPARRRERRPGRPARALRGEPRPVRRAAARADVRRQRDAQGRRAAPVHQRRRRLGPPLRPARSSACGATSAPASCRRRGPGGLRRGPRRAGTLDAAATEALRARPRGPVRMFHRDGYFGPPVEPGR